jgi:hypothetical protein
MKAQNLGLISRNKPMKGNVKNKIKACTNAFLSIDEK